MILIISMFQSFICSTSMSFFSLAPTNAGERVPFVQRIGQRISAFVDGSELSPELRCEAFSEFCGKLRDSRTTPQPVVHPATSQPCSQQRDN